MEGSGFDGRFVLSPEPLDFGLHVGIIRRATARCEGRCGPERTEVPGHDDAHANKEHA